MAQQAQYRGGLTDAEWRSLVPEWAQHLRRRQDAHASAARLLWQAEEYARETGRPESYCDYLTGAASELRREAAELRRQRQQQAVIVTPAPEPVVKRSAGRGRRSSRGLEIAAGVSGGILSIR
jgi:hypothetical protein